MKQLLFTVVALAGVLAMGADAKTTATKKADNKPEVKTEVKTEAKDAVKAEVKDAEKKAAKPTPKSSDRRIKSKEREQMRLERDKKLAEKAGMSLEQYRAKIAADRRERRHINLAKKMGLNVEEFMKLSPGERDKKIAETIRERRAKRAQAAKITPAGDAKKTEEKK